MDDLFDGRWYEITNGTPAGNRVSDIRRRNVQRPSNRAIGVFGLLSGAIEHDELHHLGKFRKTVPSRQAAHIVFSDEEEQFRVRLALPERLDGVDGIGGRWALEFHRIALEARLACDRRAHHFQTGIGRRELLLQFMRRSSSRDKDHFLELERFERVTRQNQMSVMDRIEGAAENADLFQNVSYSVVIPSAVEESLAFPPD